MPESGAAAEPLPSLSSCLDQMQSAFPLAQRPLQHVACSARGLLRRYLCPAHLEEVNMPGRLRSEALRG